MSRWLALLAIAVAGVAVLVIGVGGDDPYRVRAEFADAAGLRPGYTVRLDGVKVGRVSDVEVTARDTAVATLELDPSAAPVGRDARVSIEPSNLLGEQVVVLSPGHVDRPAPSGTLIPRTRTAVPTLLDQVISSFGPDTRRAVAIFLAEQGEGLLGRGGDIATTLASLPRSLSSTTRLVSDLGADNRALGELIERSDRIVSEIAAHRAPLGRLVAEAGDVFDAIGRHGAGLRETVRTAPGALAQVRRSLVALREAAAPIGTAADGLRRTAAPLTGALRAVPAFASAAKPTLRTVTGVAPSLDRLGRRATPVVDRLGPLGTKADEFAATLDPVSDTADAGTSDLLGLMEAWARAIQDKDAAGHLFRPYALAAMSTLVQTKMRSYIRGTPRRRPTPALSVKPLLPRPTAPKPSTATSTPRLPEIKVPAVADSVDDVAQGVHGVLDYLLGR